ncbi:hypothetical protein WICPIJ_009546 [Wickerhamomyces pijperi]|uniref:Uncharacterized protein n=1 Tax=Wickerhamomyces pijperi TaxID=599730 RepID=A0A9P8TCK3_WICPI|nr:hypothetical protein WICPIJ_009546 [Wickerhamomyces pijperi]
MDVGVAFVVGLENEEDRIGIDHEEQSQMERKLEDCLVLIEEAGFKGLFKLSFKEPEELSKNGLPEAIPSGDKKLVLLEEEGTRLLVEPMDRNPTPPPNNSTSLVASATALNLSMNLPEEALEGRPLEIPPLMEADTNKLF